MKIIEFNEIMCKSSREVVIRKCKTEMLNAKSFIELAQTAQSSKVNLRLSDKEKQYYLRLKRLVQIFSPTSSFLARAFR